MFNLDDFKLLIIKLKILIKHKIYTKWQSPKTQPTRTRSRRLIETASKDPCDKDSRPWPAFNSENRLMPSS